MGLFKDRRHRRPQGVQSAGGTAGRNRTPASVPDAEPSDQQLRIDVEQVLAQELGALTIADSDEALHLSAISHERILSWLKDQGYTFFVDSDGDIGGIWNSRLFYFLRFGTDLEILQVRGLWNRDLTIERIAEVLNFCNDWNTERIWPKAYLRVRDDGMIEVLGEVSVDYEHGASAAQLDRTLRCGLSTAAMLFDALDAKYPDPTRSAP